MKEYKPSMFPNGQFVMMWEYDGEIWSNVYRNDNGNFSCYDNNLDEFQVVSKENLDYNMKNHNGKIFTV